MFKTIKRFFQNRFWKEDKTEAVARSLRAGRLTEEETETLRKAAGDTSRSVGSPVFHESQNNKLLEMTNSLQQTNESCASYHSVTKPNPDGRGDLKSDEYQTRKAQLLEHFGAGEEALPRLFPMGTVSNVVIDPSNGGRKSPEETERCREQLVARRLMMSGQAGAFTTFNPKLGIQPNAEEADDETYALEGGHVMSQESASMYRMLCNLKHHPSYQTNPARQGLFELLRHLETGEWDPASGKVPQRQRVMKIPNEIQELVDAGASAEEIAKYKLQEVDDPEYGFRHSDFHILGAKTDPAKSVFHSGNALQSEVNHLLAMDPEKFGTDTHTEIELAVKKLGDEIDCRVTKVKVVKARLAPLSKNEASKMSPRRRKKESKKVIQASRGKHRG